MKTIFLVITCIIMSSLPEVSALDVSIHILDDYKTIKVGEDVQFQVVIKNIAQEGRHDISLTYELFKEDKLLTSVREVKAVDTQTSFLAHLTLPSDVASGNYIIRTTINDDEIAEDTFLVAAVRTSRETLQYYSLLLLVSLIFIALMILWEVHKMYRLQAFHESHHVS